MNVVMTASAPAGANDQPRPRHRTVDQDQPTIEAMAVAMCRLSKNSLDVACDCPGEPGCIAVRLYGGMALAALAAARSTDGVR